MKQSIKPILFKDADVNTIKDDAEYFKKIRHIIGNLYRIKKINRKVEYDVEELRNIILGSEQGQKVIQDLIKEEVTIAWLILNGFNRVAKVLGSEILNTKH